MDGNHPVDFWRQTEQAVRQYNFVHRIPEAAAAQVQVLLSQNNPKAAAFLAEAYELPMEKSLNVSLSVSLGLL
jgi:hypothetical protein